MRVVPGRAPEPPQAERARRQGGGCSSPLDGPQAERRDGPARAGAPRRLAQLRPLGGEDGLLGHFHAAAFGFRPIQRGKISLKDTVTALFESDEPMTVLHLLRDDRPSGAGESEFIRGACWIGRLTSEA